MTRRTLAAALGTASAGAMLACGSSPVTSDRIERAIAPTFANLVHLQLSRMGLPRVAAADIQVIASCHRLQAGTGGIGAGEWVCILTWHGPNDTRLVDTYDLSVATDGCYTATVEGAEANLGGPALPSSDGRLVRNLLYAFEGCFDTT